MKQVISLFFFLPHCCMGINIDSIPKKKILHVTVRDMGLKNSEGYLQHMDDSTIYLSARPVMYGGAAYAEKISYANMSQLYIKRKGSAGRGALYGAASGAALGALIGFISGSDKAVPPEEDFFGLGNMFRFTAGEKALFGSVMLGSSGAIIGLVAGALAKKKFIIRGKRENFSRMQKHTLDRLYGNLPNL